MTMIFQERYDEPTRAKRAEPNQSEQASLHGQKAKTPIIAGSICGGVMGLAWIIGFIIYFMKRNRRKKRKAAIAAGLLPPPDPKPSEKEFEEGIIIPPDPAVLLGQRQPGERVYVDGKLVDGSRRSSETHNPRGSAASPSLTNGSLQPHGIIRDPSLPTNPSPPPTPTTARISEEMVVPSHVL